MKYILVLFITIIIKILIIYANKYNIKRKSLLRNVYQVIKVIHVLELIKYRVRIFLKFQN